MKRLTKTVCMALSVALIICLGAPAPDSYAAAKTYNVTITVNMGKSGSSCPVLYFKQNGADKTIAYGNKFYTKSKAFDQWDKSNAWFKKHDVVVIFTSVKLPKGKYKLVCDNGSKTKTIVNNLNVSGNIKKTIPY